MRFRSQVRRRKDLDATYNEVDPQKLDEINQDKANPSKVEDKVAKQEDEGESQLPAEVFADDTHIPSYIPVDDSQIPAYDPADDTQIPADIPLDDSQIPADDPADDPLPDDSTESSESDEKTRIPKNPIKKPAVLRPLLNRSLNWIPYIQILRDE